MGEVRFESDTKVTVDDCGFKVGDILVGQTHMYRTVTHWYEVVKVSNRRMELVELPVSYPTKYMSNTSGDRCMPMIRIWDDKNSTFRYYMEMNYPYYPAILVKSVVRAVPYRTRTVEIKADDFKVAGPWRSHARILKDSYAPTLELWDGSPGWVNCD